MRFIYLDNSDDVASVCQRLGWIDQPGRVVLVLPEGSDVLSEQLDLVRIQRLARNRQLDLGLVTLDAVTGARASSLGIPLFATGEQARRSRFRWWWGQRRRRRSAQLGSGLRWKHRGYHPVSLPDMSDRRAVHRRMSPRPVWQKWLQRYLGVVTFVSTLALLLAVGAYTLPQATLVLQPEVRPVKTATVIVADPQLESVNWSGASVPGRLMTVINEWQAAVDTTGRIAVPDSPARGTVAFFNLLAEPITIPAGTRVSTSAADRVVFQVVKSVDIPGEIGGSGEAEIVAVEPGIQGNVNAHLVNRVQGSLAARLEVRNLEPTAGGSDRMSAAVAPGDHERLRAQVLQHLHELAAAEMEAGLADDEFLAQESLRVVKIYEETYSHFVGARTDRVALEIRLEQHGTAVQAAQATELVRAALTGAVVPGFILIEDSLRFQTGDVLGVDEQGRVSFVMHGEALSAAQLNTAAAVERIAGHETGASMAYLYQQMPLKDVPVAQIWPAWFGRLPYLPARIQVRLDVQGSH